MWFHNYHYTRMFNHFSQQGLVYKSTYYRHPHQGSTVKWYNVL